MYPPLPTPYEGLVEESHCLLQSTFRKTRIKYNYRYEQGSYVSTASTYIALKYPAKKFIIPLPTGDNISHVLIFRSIEYQGGSIDHLDWNLVDRVSAPNNVSFFVYEDTTPLEAQYYKVYSPNYKSKQSPLKNFRGSTNFTYLLNKVSALTSDYRTYLESKPLNYSANIIPTILEKSLFNILKSLNQPLTEIEQGKLVKSLFDGYNRAWEHYKEMQANEFVKELLSYYLAIIKGFIHDQLSPETALYCRENICPPHLRQVLDNVSKGLPLRNGRIDFIEVKHTFDLLCSKKDSKANYKTARKALENSLPSIRYELLQ